MATNVEVEKKSNENNISLIRRFSRRVKGSGILNRMRTIRYNERELSDFKKKKQVLKKIENKKKTEKLIKMGKMPERKKYGRR